MKTMDWKRGVGVACLLMTVSAGETRAQSRGPVQEPAGIPVVTDGVKALGSPFSPSYQGAWYQSQANRIAMVAWMEHDAAMRQQFIAELAASKKAAAEAAAKTTAPAKDGVMWTKVGKPVGWGTGIGKGKIISSRPVDSSMVATMKSDKMEPKATVIVEAPMMPVSKDASPVPADKVVKSEVMSETVYELKPDGTMVEMKMAPKAVVKSVDTGAPTTISSKPAKTVTK